MKNKNEEKIVVLTSPLIVLGVVFIFIFRTIVFVILGNALNIIAVALILSVKLKKDGKEKNDLNKS